MAARRDSGGGGVTSKKELNTIIKELRKEVAELKAFDPRNVGSPYLKYRTYTVPDGAATIVIPYMVNPWTGEEAPLPQEGTL